MTSVTSAARPSPKRGVLDIDLYVPGDGALAIGAPPIKLSSNETPLGPSPKALAAYHDAAARLERYPDGSATALRRAIAGRYGLDAGRIVCGAGSDELLTLLAHAYLAPGDEAIYTQHGFLVYRIAILASGATPIVAPETDLTADVDAILARVTARTKIVFLANPNNPTGTYVPVSDVRRLCNALPGHVLLVLDAAYAEYVSRNDYEAGLEIVATTENTVMTRTFSKIYGLAALRVGWAYCPSDVAEVLHRVRGPFNLSSPAIAAGAAAIADIPHMEAAAAHNAEWLPWLSKRLGETGLRVTPSVANFVLAHFPPGPKSAVEADSHLRSRNVIVRRVAAYGLPDALRITVGSEADSRAVATALADFMAA